MPSSPPIDTPQSVDTLARNAWGEARGTGATGMRRVINVHMNRVRNPRWWGHDIMSVCLAPEQFSCRNVGDPNRAKLLAVTDADPEFRVALNLAWQAIANKLPDLTNGADSYWAVSMPHPPAWASRAARTVCDGWHQFARVELPAPSGEPEAPPVSIHNVPAKPPAESAADRLMDSELLSFNQAPSPGA
jgi:hypothetical protein